MAKMTRQTRQEQAGPSFPVFYGQPIVPEYIRGEDNDPPHDEEKWKAMCAGRDAEEAARKK